MLARPTDRGTPGKGRYPARPFGSTDGAKDIGGSERSGGCYLDRSSWENLGTRSAAVVPKAAAHSVRAGGQHECHWTIRAHGLGLRSAIPAHCNGAFCQSGWWTRATFLLKADLQGPCLSRSSGRARCDRLSRQNQQNANQHDLPNATHDGPFCHIP